MLEMTETNGKVSAKRLKKLAENADLVDVERVQYEALVCEYIRRRRRLKRILSTEGKLKVLDTLKCVDAFAMEELTEDDFEIEVGPFSFNVFAASERLHLIMQDAAEDANMRARAICEDTNRPWSLIITDRAVGPTVEERVLHCIFGEALIGSTERHEDMHQFYEFWQMVVLKRSHKYRYADLLIRRRRHNKLIELNAPEVILQHEIEMQEELARELFGERKLDWSEIIERAKTEWVEETQENIKSELLAFFWSGDVKDIARRLYCAYVSDWAEKDKKRLQLNDFSKEVGVVMSMIDEALRRINMQIMALGEQGVPKDKRLLKLVAMMNIDKPLADWGGTVEN